jgi:hypothetical protein
LDWKCLTRKQAGPAMRPVPCPPGRTVVPPRRPSRAATVRRGGRLRQTSFQRRDTTPDARDKSTGRKGSFTLEAQSRQEGREGVACLFSLRAFFAALRLQREIVVLKNKRAGVSHNPRPKATCPHPTRPLRPTGSRAQHDYAQLGSKFQPPDKNSFVVRIRAYSAGAVSVSMRASALRSGSSIVKPPTT